MLLPVASSLTVTTCAQGETGVLQGACCCMHEHVSHNVAVLCASVAASLPPMQQIVFSQHML